MLQNNMKIILHISVNMKINVGKFSQAFKGPTIATHGLSSANMLPCFEMYEYFFFHTNFLPIYGKQNEERINNK